MYRPTKTPLNFTRRMRYQPQGMLPGVTQLWSSGLYQNKLNEIAGQSPDQITAGIVAATFGLAYQSPIRVNHPNIANTLGQTVREYTLISVQSGDTAGGNRAMLDNDNGTSARYFQFRMNSDAPQFIAFDTSPAASVAATSTLTAAQQASGWTMVGRIAADKIARIDVSPLNSREVLTGVGSALGGTAINLGTPTVISQFQGSAAGNQNYGGSMYWFGVWARSLTDPEVQWILHNPFGLFVEDDEDEDDYAAAAAAAARLRSRIMNR